MAKELRIYVDTSVVGGCLDDEFREASVKLMDMFRERRAVALLSWLLLQELRKAPVAVRQVVEGLPDASIEAVPVIEEAERLQTLYLREAVVGTSCANDALHVALATTARADMIVSWNFKHIVHFDKMRGFNAINLREGYAQLSIYSPLEVV
jgi:hypothetical protein